VGLMMKWLAFYNFLQKEFSEHVRRAHRGLFTLLCFCDFCFCSCSFARTLHLTFCISFFGDEASQGKNFGGSENFVRKLWHFTKICRFTKI
jgi:hypothetical protein